jgi:ferredoxin--NADP+ reductase
VRRATYWDSEMGKEDPAKKGICSNFLCDAKPGTKVNMTGALLNATLLPTCALHCTAARC